MVSFLVSGGSAASFACDLLALPLVGGTGDDQDVAGVEAVLGTDLPQLLRDAGVSVEDPDDVECHVVPTLGRAPFRAVALIRFPAWAHGPDALREAAMVLARKAAGFTHVATTLTGAHPDPAEAIGAVVEGFMLGDYSFDRYRATATRSTDRVTVLDARVRDQQARMVIDTSTTVAAATNRTRDLVNTPGGDAPPIAVAEMVGAQATERGVSMTVRTGPELADEGFGGLVAVGAGSVHEPCLVELRYAGDGGGGPPTVLVGKGITFDSGGLDLKPLSSMGTMKQDMAGAAVVAQAVLAAADLQMATPLVALLPLAENMPGGRAVKPGDVVRHRNGITSEVISPDAEGRLVLADALAYGAEMEPRAMVDVATLTGGGGVGPELWSIFGTAPGLVRAVLDAGARAGDHGWELPLWESYRRYLRSDIADQRNSSRDSRYGFGALQAALFLRTFVGDTPWAHLDTSAVASRTGADATAAWQVGATGAPVRAIIEWLRTPEREVERSADGDGTGRS